MITAAVSKSETREISRPVRTIPVGWYNHNESWYDELVSGDDALAWTPDSPAHAHSQDAGDEGASRNKLSSKEAAAAYDPPIISGWLHIQILNTIP